MAYSKEYLEKTHIDYQSQVATWEYFIRSYYGGREYKEGYYLIKYIVERDQDYFKRTEQSALDNHCRNVVQVYSSFIWRVAPTRDYGSIANDPSLEAFIKDADLDGRSFDSVMKDVQMFASVYGNCWVLIDKPPTNTKTRADELQQEIRPYASIITPENIYNWDFIRLPNGKYELARLLIREESDKEYTVYREWTLDDVTTIRLGKTDTEGTIIDQYPNPINKIPAVCVYNQRSAKRNIGISDLTDIADLQRAIYNELSEVEQLIRVSNHPSLVKTPNVEASAGAGAIIEIPEDLDASLKPYMLQPSGGNLQAIMGSIQEKVNAIDRIAHMGTVRATKSSIASGIALQTEFQLLNAKLSEKADLLENAEENIWRCWAMWQNKVFDGEIIYPESFNLRDWASDLQMYQMAKASGVKSSTFIKELDKQIAEAIISDDEAIEKINEEIEGQAERIGEFTPAELVSPTVEEVA